MRLSEGHLVLSSKEIAGVEPSRFSIARTQQSWGRRDGIVGDGYVYSDGGYFDASSEDAGGKKEGISVGWLTLASAERLAGTDFASRIKAC